MILFIVAAALSFAVFVEDDLRRQVPFWAPAVAMIALSIGREPSVVFLSLFIVPTLIMGLAVLFKRLSPIPFLVFALSDIVLGIAFSIYQSKTALWTLPEVAGWGPAAGIAAAAGVIRLGVATGVRNNKEGGLVSLGWWQGAMLAYWAGPPGLIVLVAGGVLLWAVAAYDNSTLIGMTLAGGTLAIVAGLGAGLFGVMSVGFAGTALALGERTISAWAVGILPVSLVTTAAIPGGQFIAAPALLFPAAWTIMSARVGAIKASWERVPLLGTAAAVVAFAYLGAVAEAVIAVDVGKSTALAGLPLPGVSAMWLILGAVAAGGLAAGVTSGSAPAHRPGFQVQAPRAHSQFVDLVTKLVPAVGWFTFSVAVLVTVRLFLAGFRTGFL